MPGVWEKVYEQIAYGLIDTLKWVIPAVLVIVIIKEILHMGEDAIVNAVINNIPKKYRKLFAIWMLLIILCICIGILYGFDMEIVYHN